MRQLNNGICLHNSGDRTTSFSSPSSIGEVFLSDDEVNLTSTLLEEEGLKREKIEMVKQVFGVEKVRPEKEWIRELMEEKERLKKEGEVERIEKERLIKELEIARLEQEKVRREKEMEEQRLIQEKTMEFERIRLAEEKEWMIREQIRLEDQKVEELHRREKQLREDEVLRLEKLLKEEEVARLENLLKEEKMREMQRQAVLIPTQRNNNLHVSVEHRSGVQELDREITLPVQSKGCHDDVVEEQQRILEMILKEKKEEEVNQQLIRSLCSPDQPRVKQPQPILTKWHVCKMQKEPNCWEKVKKRRKEHKSEIQSTTDLGGVKTGEKALEIETSKKRENEEQLRRGSRNNTHQKIIMVPNFTEDPNSCEAELESLADAPELSLANRRRRVDMYNFF